MTKPELRNLSLFLLKGSISTLGIFFIAYQFSFSNFAKVELDAVKLKAEVEEARGVAYDDFADMKCVVKPKTKPPTPNKKANTDSKTTTTDSTPNDVGNKGEKQEAKIDPTHHIEYAKCVLAIKTKEQASSIINLTVVFGEFLFLISALMLAAGLILYPLSSVPDKKTNSKNEPEETKQDNQGDSDTSPDHKGEGVTEDQHPEVPKSSPEGTNEEAKPEKDK
jgi:hypothetical protein